MCVALRISYCVLNRHSLLPELIFERKKIILGLECPQEIMAQAHCGTVQIKYTVKSLTIYFTYIKNGLV